VMHLHLLRVLQKLNSLKTSSKILLCNVILIGLRWLNFKFITSQIKQNAAKPLLAHWWNFTIATSIKLLNKRVEAIFFNR